MTLPERKFAYNYHPEDYDLLVKILRWFDFIKYSVIILQVILRIFFPQSRILFIMFIVLFQIFFICFFQIRNKKRTQTNKIK